MTLRRALTAGRRAGCVSSRCCPTAVKLRSWTTGGGRRRRRWARSRSATLCATSTTVSCPTMPKRRAKLMSGNASGNVCAKPGLRLPRTSSRHCRTASSCASLTEVPDGQRERGEELLLSGGCDPAGLIRLLAGQGIFRALVAHRAALAAAPGLPLPAGRRPADERAHPAASRLRAARHHRSIQLSRDRKLSGRPRWSGSSAGAGRSGTHGHPSSGSGVRIEAQTPSLATAAAWRSAGTSP